MSPIRPVEPADVPSVVGLVHELAEYQRAGAECTLTAEQLHAALFRPGAALFGHVAVTDEPVADQAVADEAAADQAVREQAVTDEPVADQAVVGCALWFLNFSTWRGAHGIYLEDLYVKPAYRRHGIGRSLLAELARECVRRGYERLEWAVLDWNEPAIEFYRSAGARTVEGWTHFRLEGPDLRRL